MALPYNSTGTIPWGSFILVPTTGIATGVNFIANDFECTEPTEIIDRKTALNAPNGFILTEQARTGRGELQLETTSTLAPERGDEFTKVLRPGTSAKTFVFTEIGLPKKQNGIDVVPVQFREKI